MDIFEPILNILLITLVGLLIAFSPMIVIVNVIVVLKSTRPILRTIVLMAGMALPLIIIAVAASLLLSPDSHVSIGSINDKINIPPLINLLFGLWLVGLGLRRRQYALEHGGPKKSAALIMQHPPNKLSALFTFAFVKSLLSVTNIFAILFACNLIISKSIAPPASILAILWVILIGLLPFLAILYFYFFKHERLELLSTEVDRLLKRNIDLAINLVLIGIGGLIGFTSLIHVITR